MHYLTRFSLRNPGITGAIILLITLIAGIGALRIETNAGFRAYVGPDHPSVRQLDKFIERFGGGLPVAAVWSCEHTEVCDSVFDDASLMMAYEVASSMEKTPGVRSVQSPATSAVLMPTTDGFEVRTFVSGGRPVNGRELLIERAMVDPHWQQRLVSKDGQTGAILLELASSESDLNLRVMEELQAALEPFEDVGFDFKLVGDPVEFVVAGGELRRDSLRLIPVIVVLIGSVLFGLFRSWLASIISLGSIGLAVVWAFGAMGWLGWPQTAVSQALAPFILTVGICNAIHVLSRYATEGSGKDASDPATKAGLLVDVVVDVGAACLVAATTTAAGFASFATSGAVSFVHFGLIAAIGVLSGLVLSFTLLPILLVRMNPKDLFAPKLSTSWDAVLRSIVRGAQERAGVVLALAVAIGGVSLLGIGLLRVDVSVSSLFGEETPVVQWIRFVRDHLRTPETLDVVLQLPPGESIEKPEVLNRVEELGNGIGISYGGGEVSTIVTSLRWANRLVHGDDPEYQKLGDTGAANAELLLLLSLNDPTNLDRWMSLDRRFIRVSIEANSTSYADAGGRLEAVRKYLDASLPVGWRGDITGAVSLRFDMVDEVQATQLRSFATAAVVVFGLVAIFLRSMSWALAAMIPTIFPVLVTLGAMGAWGIYLDMGTAMVAAVVLGVAIDDTVHLLVQYRRRRARGMEPAASMRESALHVGRAVVTTSIALSLGFFVLTLSSWASVASFGFLSGLAILGAMLADLIVLPALVIAIARLQQRSKLARKLWAT